MRCTRVPQKQRAFGGRQRPVGESLPKRALGICKLAAHEGKRFGVSGEVLTSFSELWTQSPCMLCSVKLSELANPSLATQPSPAAQEP